MILNAIFKRIIMQFNGLNPKQLNWYSYDGAGNQICEQNCTTGQITENSFSVKGELLESTVSNGTETILTQINEYNGNGTRISRTENGSKRTFYYSDGSLAYARTGSGLTYANILSPEGSVIEANLGNTYCTYFKDAQGSTSCIVNASNTAVAVYSYGDFGETNELAGSNTVNEICYTGAVYDKSTGQYYLVAKFECHISVRLESHVRNIGVIKWRR